MQHHIKIEKITSVKQIKKCAKFYPAAYNTEPWNDNWTYETATALLSCYYNTPKFVGWIAAIDEMIIGCAIGNIEPYYSGNIFILKELFVAVDAQNSGAGSSLLATVKNDMDEAGVKMTILFTRRPIVDFYTKSGFIEMEGVVAMINAR
ncbi:MAG: Spermine/spermidine acetyltransferase [Mucilaginibacter sp.]|nr:Spermine/spermidine acetyltransferase [Mucilaginibacter sp.]